MLIACRILPALVLCAILCGCGSKNSDSDPPPGVRKNEHPQTDISTSKKGKPTMVDPAKPVQ